MFIFSETIGIIHEENIDPISEGRDLRSRILRMLPTVISLQIAARESVISSSINDLVIELSIQSPDDFKNLESIKSLGESRLKIIKNIEDKIDNLGNCVDRVPTNDMPFVLKEPYRNSWRAYIDLMKSGILAFDILPNAESIYQSILDETERRYQSMMNASEGIYENELAELEGGIKDKSIGVAIR